MATGKMANGKATAKPKSARKPRTANVLTDPAMFAGAKVEADPAPTPIEAPSIVTVAETAPVETAREAALPAWVQEEAVLEEAAPEAVKPVIAEAPQSVPAAETAEINVNKVQTGATIMTDTINNTVNQAQEAAQQTATQIRGAMNDVNERSKAALERSARVAEEMADLSRGNMEALVASQKTAAKYVETLAQGAADYSRRSFEQASTAMRSFTEVKSPTDFFRLQSDFARSAFDQMVSETARVSETVVKMSGEVAEPITSRYAVAADRMKAMAA